MEAFNVTGSLNLNKLIMAHDFRLQETIELTREIIQTKQVVV